MVVLYKLGFFVINLVHQIGEKNNVGKLFQITVIYVGHLTHCKEMNTDQMKTQRMKNLLSSTQSDLWDFNPIIILY